MSPPEKKLWRRLRCEKTEFRFRRQYPAGPFFLDFYCPEVKVCVEVDGFTHEFSIKRDAKRDAWLTSKAIRVIRIDAFWIGKDIDSVVAHIKAICSERAAMLT